MLLNKHVLYLFIFADCNDVPVLFLPHGLAVGDDVYPISDMYYMVLEFPSMQYNIFGIVHQGLTFRGNGWASITSKMQCTHIGFYICAK